MVLLQGKEGQTSHLLRNGRKKMDAMNRSTFLSLLVAPFVLPLLPKEEKIVYGGRWQGEADEPSGIDYEALERDYWYALGRDGGRIPNPKIWETNIPRTYRWDDGKESWEPITS